MSKNIFTPKEVPLEIQLEVLMMFGAVLNRSTHPDPGAYWGAVHDYLHVQYPELSPSKGYPYNRPRYSENGEAQSMDTLQAIWEWQKVRTDV